MFQPANWKSDFPETIAQIEEAQKDAEVRRNRLTLSEVPLSIGVMGQVKAGKSSFLNSLLFNGQTLLPEAATPKTANLTRIRYADKPKFTARFYHPDDWALIEKQAANDNPDDASRAARELVASARSSGSNIAQMLEQRELTREADDIAGLMGALNDYVGGDGKLTALVAETELALPLEQLKGIEIVDTPGMNDPVVSRTVKTREYMAQCDVVFFLSRASQFLDASDQALMTIQLPQKGIKRLVLVSAQFDMAVLDDGFNRKNLDACISRLQEKLTRYAATVFENLAVDREKQEMLQSASLLRNTGAPIFTSTHAWIVANRPSPDWHSSVKHTCNELSEMANDCWRTPLSMADWERLANMKPLAQALAQARADKISILEQQRVGLEAEIASQRANLLRLLQDQAEARINFLKNNDLKSLEQQEEAQQEQIRKINEALSAFLQNRVNKTKEREQKFLEEINAKANRTEQIQARVGYQNEKQSIRISDETWWKPWTWGDHHYKSYTRIKSYEYLNVSDVVESLNFYVQEIATQIGTIFEDLIAPHTVSAELRKELFQAIDKNASDFDSKGLRALVESNIGTFEFPELTIKTPSVNEIFSGYAGEIRDKGEICNLKHKLSEEVQKINSNLLLSIQDGVENACKNWEKISIDMKSRLTKRYSTELEKVRKLMEERELNISRLNDLIESIK